MAKPLHFILVSIPWAEFENSLCEADVNGSPWSAETEYGLRLRQLLVELGHKVTVILARETSTCLKSPSTKFNIPDAWDETSPMWRENQSAIFERIDSDKDIDRGTDVFIALTPFHAKWAVEVWKFKHVIEVQTSHAFHMKEVTHEQEGKEPLTYKVRGTHLLTPNLPVHALSAFFETGSYMSVQMAPRGGKLRHIRQPIIFEDDVKLTRNLNASEKFVLITGDPTAEEIMVAIASVKIVRKTTEFKDLSLVVACGASDIRVRETLSRFPFFIKDRSEFSQELFDDVTSFIKCADAIKTSGKNKIGVSLIENAVAVMQPSLQFVFNDHAIVVSAMAGVPIIASNRASIVEHMKLFNGESLMICDDTIHSYSSAIVSLLTKQWGTEEQCKKSSTFLKEALSSKKTVENYEKFIDEMTKRDSETERQIVKQEEAVTLREEILVSIMN